jgi:DNA repair protein RadC
MSINHYITDEHATGYREATLDEIMTRARQALRNRVHKGTVLSSPRMTANYLTARLAVSGILGLVLRDNARFARR